MRNSIEDSFLPMPDDYGLFPFITVRLFSATFKQIPVVLTRPDASGSEEGETDNESTGSVPTRLSGVHPVINTDWMLVRRREFLKLPEVREELTRCLRHVSEEHGNKLSCLVLSENDAIYINKGKIYEADSPPAGGMLYDQKMRPLDIRKNGSDGRAHYRKQQPEWIRLGNSDI
ncbi:MAG: hypothetical protein LAT84_12710 [Balneolia bacterium]|nr:hypothetical protein [Balneolia bacterium]